MVNMNSDLASAYHENSHLIRITATEDSTLALENLSSFLYDIVLVHDRLLLFFNGNYHFAALSGLPFYRRNRRPIDKSERLEISLINKQSPLVIEIAVATAILAWTLIQILRALIDWKLDRQIKEEQLRKLILENIQQSNSLKLPDSYMEFERGLIKDIKRLGMNEQVNIKEVDDISNG